MVRINEFRGPQFGNAMRVFVSASVLAIVLAGAAPAFAFDVEAAASARPAAPDAASEAGLAVAPAGRFDLCPDKGESPVVIGGVTACFSLSDVNQVTSAFGVVSAVEPEWNTNSAAGLPAGLAGGEEGGWSVMTGLNFDLPGPVDAWLQGGYADGAAVPPLSSGRIGPGLWTGSVIDDPLTSGFYQNRQFGEVGAGLSVQASEDLRLGFGASYSTLRTDNMPQTNIVSVGGGFFWNPVENMDLGLSVLYSELVSGFAPAESEVSLSAGMKRDF